MYKVFLNDRLISIGGPALVTLNKSSVIFNKNSNLQELNNWFDGYLKSDEKEVFLIHPHPEEFFKMFQSMFITVPAAGGMVLRENKLLFIFRNGKWDLPKGKIDTGESVQAAAIREVSEECGISALQIVKTLPSTFHIYISPYKKSEGKWIFKETFWFEMIYTGTEPVRPQTEEGIAEIRWYSANELDEVLLNTYENLKQIINLYLG